MDFRCARDGVELAGKVLGAGKPILWVHGFPFGHTMWQEQLDVFAEDYQLIAPDLRGFGESMLTPEDADSGVDMATYADDLAAVLDELRVDEPVILCGFSMGGYILWQFAKRYPERVKALVLCDTRAVADSQEASEGRLKMAAELTDQGVSQVAAGLIPKLLAKRTLAERADLVDQITEMICAESASAIAAAQRGMARRPDAREDLSSFDWPALVLVGAEDAISPPEEMQGIAAQLPQAEFVEIPGAGHMTVLENPAAVNEAFGKFFAAHLGS